MLRVAIVTLPDCTQLYTERFNETVTFINLIFVFIEARNLKGKLISKSYAQL